MRVCPECRSAHGNDLTTCPRDGAVLIELPAETQSAQVVDRDALQRLQSLAFAGNRYSIAEKIGQGGWGGVYRAYQHSTKREVALKVLRQDVADDVEARRRFHREAEAVSKLRHPNTITIFDFGETSDGTLFIAMEYLAGRTLDRLLREEGPLPPRRAVRIARQIALSLAEAHDKGIIHRDIKPQNIMVMDHEGEPDHVKVLDFGVAKVASAGTGLTGTGTTFGTPEYMSPEQVQSHDLDNRSDLYALGIVLYEMLTGAPPFTGDTAITVAMKHVRSRPPSLRLHLPCPRHLPALLKSLLAKSRNDRPASALVVARELEVIQRLLGQDGGGAGTGGISLGRALTSHWAALLTGAALLLVLAAGGWALHQRLAQGTAEEQRPVAWSSSPRAPAGRPAAGSGAALAAGRGLDENAGTSENRAGTTAKSVALPGAPTDTEGGPPGVSPKALSGVATVEAGTEPGVLPRAIGAVTGQGAESSGTAEISDAGRGKPSAGEEAATNRGTPGGGQEVGGAGKERKEEPAAAPAVVKLKVVANAPGAVARVGEGPACPLPCELEGRRGESRRLRVTAPGFQSTSRTVTFDGRQDELQVKLTPVSLSESDQLKGGLSPSTEDGLK